jgi:multidrug resistance efflux pump
MDAEIDLYQIEKRIRGRVKKQMEKSQREYYLNEQMKAIQKELGDLDEAPNELDDLQRGSKRAACPKKRASKAQTELAKLKADVADVGRGDGRAQLSRLDPQRAVEEEEPGAQGPQDRAAHTRRRSLRPRGSERTAYSSTWPCSRGSTRSRARCSAWWGLQA